MQKIPSGIVRGLAVLLTLAAAWPVAAQEEPASVYVRKYVRLADGSLNTQTPPEATFTVYLNGDDSRVLVENVPRWDGSGEGNINDKGTFGVEVGNFPELTAGDSVFVRFTNNVAGQQGRIVVPIDAIPWVDQDPFTALMLQPADLPAPPRDVQLANPEPGVRTLTWTAEAGLTYSVYRRDLEDLLANGQSRRLYERVAEGLTAGTWTDPETDPERQFGYLVYAHTADGVTGSHSAEAVERRALTGLAATATATNATLTWDAFDVPVGETVGYTIYRREAGGRFGTPLAFTGPETHYTDTRLAPGTTYEYQVRARNAFHQAFGESEPVAVTTEADTSRYYTYASFKVAVAIYRNTNDPYQMPAQEAEDIQRLLEYTRLFYWRHSNMKLNVEYTFFVFDDYKEFGTGAGTTAQQTARHLAEDFGVVNKQFDYILRISPATTGYWSIGAPVLDLPDLDGGEKRRTGFCHINWPKYSGAGYPFAFDDIETPPAVVWTALHEMQHVIDALYRWNGHEEMPHGDFPQDFDLVPTGRHYDFQAAMFRTFPYYEDLLPEWGDIYESVDADGDGFPDADPDVILDEARFGSSPDAADTDGDGLADKQETRVGLYHYGMADPHDPDTDGDGVADGADRYPRYPVDWHLKRFTPTIDGRVQEGWPLVNDTVSYTSSTRGYAPKLYMSYDDDSLYLALDLPDIGVPTLFFDFGADGRLFGAGNTEVEIDVVNGRFTTFHSLDGTPEVRAYDADVNGRTSGRPLWDNSNTYQDGFGRRVLYPSTVNLQTHFDAPRIQVEMAIPRNEYAGLTLQPGDSLGLYIDYRKANNEPGAWANTFDEYSLATLVLSAETNVAREPEEVVETFSLGQNYPNPFNPTTTIGYTVPAGTEVKLVVYDLLGRRIRTLVDGYRAAGAYRAAWDGRDAAGAPVASGVYLYRLHTADGHAQVRRMLLLK